MNWQLENLREYASLGGSMLALASTFYFWLVRANRERSRLAVHPIGDMQGTALMAMDDVETYRRLSPTDDQMCVKYWLHLAIVNNSSLPNALLGARVWLWLASGEMREMDVRHESPDQDLFPANLSPLTTVSLKLALAATIDKVEDNSFAGRAAAAGDLLPPQIPIRIELEALQGQKFVCEIIDHCNGLQRSSYQQQAA